MTVLYRAYGPTIILQPMANNLVDYVTQHRKLNEVNINHNELVFWRYGVIKCFKKICCGLDGFLQKNYVDCCGVSGKLQIRLFQSFQSGLTTVLWKTISNIKK